MTKSAKILTTTAIIASLASPASFLQYNINQNIENTLYGPPYSLIEQEEKEEEKPYATEKNKTNIEEKNNKKE